MLGVKSIQQLHLQHRDASSPDQGCVKNELGGPVGGPELIPLGRSGNWLLLPKTFERVGLRLNLRFWFAKVVE